MPEASQQSQKLPPPDERNKQGKEERDLHAELPETIDAEVKLLAAIAYGEASIEDNPEEVLGIAFAVANRARAWGGKTISAVLNADANYTYAADGTNIRFNKLRAASIAELNKSLPMRTAINAAMNALDNKGQDPSNGAYWWDGADLKLRKNVNPRISHGFKYGAQEHNIFEMEPISKVVIVRWIVIHKKSGKQVDGTERGRYDATYISTAARGKTIFWRYNPDYVKATGAKEHK
jgi:hypothetical protein